MQVKDTEGNIFTSPAGEETLRKSLGDWRPVVAVANLTEPKQRVKHASVDQQGILFGLDSLG